MAQMYQVVIVDDEKQIAEGIADLFPWESIGFHAAYFTDPRAAILYAESHPFDVLLSDIEMPGLSGLELCQEIMKINNEIIVVFLSSHQNFEYMRSAIQFGVTDYILKPMKSSDILECFGKIKAKLDEKRGNKPDDEPQNYYDKIFRIVRDYLRDNYKSASLEEAAVQVSLSPAYLSSILKEKCGVKFSDLLLETRMEKAKELLRDIHYKSYDIAYHIGYDNPKSFSRAFKNYYGITPAEYRNGKNVQQ